jgi:hypothetical protein
MKIVRKGSGNNSNKSKMSAKMRRKMAFQKRNKAKKVSAFEDYM